jgi:hypothetical protein
MENYGIIKVSNIREVTHLGYQKDNSYICRLDLEFPDGDTEINVPYATNSAAKIQPGKYVYEQILAGNFSGDIVEAPEPQPPVTDDELIEELTDSESTDNAELPST